MRKLHVRTAASALAFATPVLAQGIFRVPPGQMPPAGMCRIWIDGVPPGRQPAPMNCEAAARRMPANAHLIYGQGVRGNNGYYNNDRIYQDEIRRQRELEIARERQLQIEREREFQMARQRELFATSRSARVRRKTRGSGHRRFVSERAAIATRPRIGTIVGMEVRITGMTATSPERQDHRDIRRGTRGANFPGCTSFESSPSLSPRTSRAAAVVTIRAFCGATGSL